MTRAQPGSQLPWLLALAALVAVAPVAVAQSPEGEGGEQDTEGEGGEQDTEDDGAQAQSRSQPRTASTIRGSGPRLQCEDVTAGQATQPDQSGDGEGPAFLDTTHRQIEDDRPPPTAAQVAALEQMESEVDRFGQSGESYQSTVNSLLRREYLRQRRSRNQWYTRQINEEEQLLDEARERAIRLFERFIRRYPDDPSYTPDAMFRLGELYFERSQIRFQRRYDEAREKGEDPPLQPDFNATIDLYQRLVRDFPDYHRLDGVYYLIGYCLNEMGRYDEARVAWLSLVCANDFEYDPDDFLTEEDEEGEGDEEGEPGSREEDMGDEHPALTMDGDDGDDEDAQGFDDPYARCQPIVQNARFVSETWFRIGEHHFDDYGDPHALDLAIAAYQKITDDPEDRNYNLALYKLAWAYYRASRYPEAIDHFGKLVDWSDEQQQSTGRAGSELRPEAIQYLGIAFAYDDWNENQIPDTDEGMPTPIERVQNEALLPQDRGWTPEVYFQLGQVLFDEAKYDEAVAVWEMALERWPSHPRAPEITNQVARAHQEQKSFEKAIEARARLGNFGPGSNWYDSNRDHPGAQRKAEELAENALIGTAIYYHQQAQQLRRQCVAQQDLSLCEQAQENYSLAGEAYGKYLERYPNDPQAYELRYNLADAYYWSENYEQAFCQYSAVRDSNLDDVHMVEAARRVVESVKRLAEEQEKKGAMTTREEPPEPEGEPPSVDPIDMPEMLQHLARAREIYMSRVSDEEDTESVLRAYEFNNALLLYQYGYWDQARERFGQIFDNRCKGPYADETGRVAWINLRNIAVSLNDTDEVERLARALQEKQCTFAADGEEALASAGDCESQELKAYCAKEENKDEPRCLVCRDLGNICYKRAIDETYKPAEKASGERQRKLYESAATKLVECVNREPNHPDAPIALEMAATALEKTQRFESAARIYQRIIDEVGPMDADSPEEEQRLDRILANAYFRLAFNANRFFDFDRAVENYRLIADSRRFRSSDDDNIKSKREDALINAALILERLQRYSKAMDYYDRAAQTVEDGELERKARYRMAEVAYKQRSYGRATQLMRDFIKRYERQEGAGELVVQAYWRIAQIRDKTGRRREYRSALQDVVRAFERSGQKKGSLAAEYAANAAFEIADDNDVEAFESYKVDLGNPADMDALVKRLVDQIKSGLDTAKDLSGRFEDPQGYGRPTWTIAALVKQGRIYEVLARGILETEVVLPRDMKRQLGRLSPAQKDEIRWKVEDKVREVLDARVRPIECLGVQRYALAARAARAGSIDDDHTRTAIDRLQAYGDERIAECIEEARKEDSSFGAYKPGEFKRAPRGKNRQPEPGVGPPPLAQGGE